MIPTTIETEPLDGDAIVQVRSYRLLRQIAKDWQGFSNDALGRIQIPAEDQTRDFRQYPIEADPPAHTAYRALVQKVFDQPHDPAYAARVEALVGQMLAAAQAAGEVEIVGEFALPLQSRALTLLLLGMPEAEAEIWIGWGIHAFRGETGYDLGRARRLVDYIADRWITRRSAGRAVSSPICATRSWTDSRCRGTCRWGLRIWSLRGGATR